MLVCRLICGFLLGHPGEVSREAWKYNRFAWTPNDYRYSQSSSPIRVEFRTNQLEHNREQLGELVRRCDLEDGPSPRRVDYEKAEVGEHLDKSTVENGTKGSPTHERGR